METTKNMTVLIATGLYPPEIGGPATYVRMLEEELPQHGIMTVTVPFGRVRHMHKIVRHIAYMLLLLREAKKANVIYALDPVSVGAPAWIASLLARRPFVVRVAGDFAWEQAQLRYGVRDSLEVFYQRRFSYTLPVKLFSFVEGFIASRARLVIIPCKYLTKVMRRWGVAAHRIVTIYSALDPLPVSISKEDSRARLGYSGVVIVSAGRLVPNKGFVKLIEAFASLDRHSEDYHLIIVGDGPDEASLRSLVEKLELQNSVVFMGKLNKMALGEVIAAADVFVLNTEHEGFSHQLLEVMDLGIPIVTTAVGGNTELIENERSGLLVAFNDKAGIKRSIELILSDSRYAAFLTSEAKKDIEVFNQDSLVGELVIQLRRLIK